STRAIAGVGWSAYALNSEPSGGVAPLFRKIPAKRVLFRRKAIAVRSKLAGEVEMRDELSGCASRTRSVRRTMISIVDYGMGNLRSVQKAFERIGHEATIARTAQEVGQADYLVLPG